MAITAILLFACSSSETEESNNNEQNQEEGIKLLTKRNFSLSGGLSGINYFEYDNDNRLKSVLNASQNIVISIIYDGENPILFNYFGASGLQTKQREIIYNGSQISRINHISQNGELSHFSEWNYESGNVSEILVTFLNNGEESSYTNYEYEYDTNSNLSQSRETFINGINNGNYDPGFVFGYNLRTYDYDNNKIPSLNNNSNAFQILKYLDEDDEFYTYPTFLTIENGSTNNITSSTLEGFSYINSLPIDEIEQVVEWQSTFEYEYDIDNFPVNRDIIQEIASINPSTGELSNISNQNWAFIYEYEIVD